MCVSVCVSLDSLLGLFVDVLVLESTRDVAASANHSASTAQVTLHDG